MNEADILSFVGTSLRSVWALDVLMVLYRERDAPWRSEDIVRETRSSQMAVSEAIMLLKAAALVTEKNGYYRYAPSTVELDQIATQIENLYAKKPVAVLKAIVTAAPDRRRKR